MLSCLLPYRLEFHLIHNLQPPRGIELDLPVVGSEQCDHAETAEVEGDYSLCPLLFIVQHTAINTSTAILFSGLLSGLGRFCTTLF